jgi:hypothetical protein
MEKLFYKDTLPSSRIFPAITLLLFVYFSGLVFFEIHQTAFLYDSAIHIDASKFFAYALGNPITPYTFELLSTQTTGPTVTLFGAAITRLLGNQIWTPGTAIALLNLSIFAILLIRLHQLYGKKATLLAAVFFTIFMVQDIQSWVFFIGEIPAMLLFLVSALFAVDEKIGERQRYLYIAIAITLALRARLIILPMAAGVFGYLLLQQISLIWQGHSSIKKLAAILLLSSCIFLLIFLVLDSFEYSFFLFSSDAHYIDLLKSRADFLASNSTVGIGKLIQSENITTQIISNIKENYTVFSGTLQKHLGMASPIPLLLIPSLLTIATLFCSRHVFDKLIFVISISASLTAIWFFAISQTVFDRYAMPLIFLLLAWIALTVCRFFSWIGLVILLTATYIITPIQTKQQLLHTITFQEKQTESAAFSKQYNRNMIETVAYLKTLPSSIPLAKCGWMTAVWSIDYLLPPGEHFIDCYTSIKSSLAFDEEYFLQNNPETKEEIRKGHYRSAEDFFLKSDRSSPVRYKWEKPVNFILVMDKITWKFSKFNKAANPAKAALIDACKPGMIFENESYRIMNCKFENIQTVIPTDSYGFFVDDTPYWKR